MYTHRLQPRRAFITLLTCAFLCCANNNYTFAQQARQGMIEAKPEFDEFAQSIPDADHIMDEVKMRLAEQFAPAVLELPGAAGRVNERDILARLLR